MLVLTALTAWLAGGLFWEGQSPVAWFSEPRALFAGWRYAFWLLAILGAHEMGHYLACRYYGVRATLPFFVPGLPPFGTFGAVIRIRSRIPDPRALFDIAAAGPIAGFAVALPVLVAGLLEAEPVLGPLPEGGIRLGPPLVSSVLERWLYPGADLRVGSLYGAGWVGMLVTSMNLFPVGQLDGGHVAYAVSRTLHRILARATLAGMLALVVYQSLAFRSVPAYALWFVVLLWMRDRHPRLADETVRLGAGRRAIAVALLLVFFATFIPVPLSFP